MILPVSHRRWLIPRPSTPTPTPKAGRFFPDLAPSQLRSRDFLGRGPPRRKSQGGGGFCSQNPVQGMRPAGQSLGFQPLTCQPAVRWASWRGGPFLTKVPKGRVSFGEALSMQTLGGRKRFGLRIAFTQAPGQAEKPDSPPDCPLALPAHLAEDCPERTPPLAPDLRRLSKCACAEPFQPPTTCFTHPHDKQVRDVTVAPADSWGSEAQRG